MRFTRRIQPIIWAAIGGAAALILVIIAAYVGVFDIPDSYFYVTLGQYFYTGETVPINPYNIDKPQLLFGPIYGILLYPLLSAPWPYGMTLIPLIQLLLILTGSICIYFLTRSYLPRPWPIVGAFVYFFFPFNLIYGTYLMSENLTQFWIILYMISLYRYLRGKHAVLWASMLITIGMLATLTRYVYGILFAVGILTLLYTLAKKPSWIKSAITKPLMLMSLVPAAIGVGVIVAWMHFHYTVNGTWSLTTFTGRHVFNNVVTLGHFLPPREHPSMDMFTKVYPEKFPEDESIFRPWWWTQLGFNDGVIKETTLDKWFLNVSIAAVLHNPVAYVGHLARVYFIEPATAPYYPEDIVANLHACREPLCTTCVEQECRVKWNSNMCRPARQSCAVLSMWGSFVAANIALYPVGATVIFLLALAGSLWAIISKHIWLRWIAGLFLFIHLIQSATEWIEGRFLVPLYPLYAVMVTIGIWRCSKILQRATRIPAQDKKQP